MTETVSATCYDLIEGFRRRYGIRKQTYGIKKADRYFSE